MEQMNLVPRAESLMGSMRSMGYSFESAVADVIDNSVSAGSACVRLLFPMRRDEDLAVGILDDGEGMSRDELFEAMRYGSADVEEVRSTHDLGRFGLGMKAASLSQCRILTVVSKRDGQLAAYEWNYNVIRERQEWVVLAYADEELKALPYVDRLSEQDHGTLVIWREFDLLAKAGGKSLYEVLDDLKETLAQYLGLIFHRYLSSRFAIYINHGRVSALDPFLESNPKTTDSFKEQTYEIMDSRGGEQLIRVKPYILPYGNSLTRRDERLLGPTRELKANQGFYIYRNKRLIVWGKWFGMKPRGELYKNARIRVDIPNTLDDIWGINIMKGKAVLPNSIKRRLSQVVEETIGSAVNQQTYRGRKSNPQNLDYIWNRIEERSGTYTYQVNRESPVYKMVRDRLCETDAACLEMLIAEIETNLPVQQIYIDKANNTLPERRDDKGQDMPERLLQLSIATVDNLVEAGHPISEAIELLMHSEPFSYYEFLKDKLLQHYQP